MPFMSWVTAGDSSGSAVIRPSSRI
jgi:hypothetical protein